MAVCETNSRIFKSATVFPTRNSQKEKLNHPGQIEICFLIMVIFSLTFHILMVILSFYIKKQKGPAAVPSQITALEKQT